MLEVIVYVVGPVFVVLVASYFYVERQRKKVKEQAKKAIVLRVAAMKDDFKLNIKQLVDQQILAVTSQETMYRIVNNFFVFQSVTINNISYCEQLLESVIGAIPTINPDGSNLEHVQDQVSLFVQSFPTTARGYNAVFYQQQLPKLVKQLVDAQAEPLEQSELLPCSSNAA